MSTTRAPTPRSDRRRNRAAILEAARELLGDAAEVPMYEIGRRSGVGQATLYRHFPTRDDLIVAMFEAQLDELEQVAAEHAGEPGLFLDLLRRVVDDQARFHGLVDCLGTPAGAGLRARLEHAMAPPLRDAVAAGVVRADIEVNDVHRMVAMVDGVLRHESDVTVRAGAAGRVLDLLQAGLRSTP